MTARCTSECETAGSGMRCAITVACAFLLVPRLCPFVHRLTKESTERGKAGFHFAYILDSSASEVCVQVVLFSVGIGL